MDRTYRHLAKSSVDGLAASQRAEAKCVQESARGTGTGITAPLGRDVNLTNEHNAVVRCRNAGLAPKAPSPSNTLIPLYPPRQSSHKIPITTTRSSH